VHEPQDVVRHEAVVQHHVGALHQLHRAQRQQAGVARARADEEYGAGAGARGGRAG
jgi:hypothetical protein